MIQRMKIDVILFIIGLTFLIYSLFGGEMSMNETTFRFIIGIEFMLGSLYLIISPENRWLFPMKKE